MTKLPNADSTSVYRRHRFPAEIIGHAVWLYYRFPLSLRDVEDLLAERGIDVSFQTVCEWTAKFGRQLALMRGSANDVTLQLRLRPQKSQLKCNNLPKIVRVPV